MKSTISIWKKTGFLCSLLIIAVNIQSFAQDTTYTEPSKLLTSYYRIKDALVSGHANTVSVNAGLFVNAINATSREVIKEERRNALLKGAQAMAQSKDLKTQREIFSDFSANMISLAKDVKLSTAPIYQQYCPMKKASWLSSSKEIKNPYYGSAMLTCGSIKETL